MAKGRLYKSKWEPICVAGHLPNRDSKGISVFLFGIKLDEDGKLKVSQAGKKSYQRNKIRVVFLEIQVVG